MCDRAFDAAELPVSKNARNPGTAELPVVTDAHRAEIAVAADFLTEGQGRITGKVRDVSVGVEHAITATAEDVEAGPVIGRRHHRSLGRDGRPGRPPRPIP